MARFQPRRLISLLRTNDQSRRLGWLAADFDRKLVIAEWEVGWKSDFLANEAPPAQRYLLRDLEVAERAAELHRTSLLRSKFDYSGKIRLLSGERDRDLVRLVIFSEDQSWRKRALPLTPSPFFERTFEGWLRARVHTERL